MVLARRAFTYDPPNIDPNLIIEVVADVFRVTPEDIRGKARFKEIQQPRQIAIILCRELTGISYQRIGAYFQGRDHTTLMFSVERRNDLLQIPRLAQGYADAYRQLTDIEPSLPAITMPQAEPELPIYRAFQGVPVEILAHVSQQHTRIRFIGTPPEGFDEVLIVNRGELNRPPTATTIESELETQLAYLKPLVLANKASAAQVRRLENVVEAIRLFEGEE